MKMIGDVHVRQARMIRKLSPARRVIATRLWQRQEGLFRCMQTVISGVVLVCLLGLSCRAAVQAADAEPIS